MAAHSPHSVQLPYRSSGTTLSGTSGKEVITLPNLPATPREVMSPLERPKVPRPQTKATCRSDQLLVKVTGKGVPFWSRKTVFLPVQEANRGSTAGETASPPASRRCSTRARERRSMNSWPSILPWSHSGAGSGPDFPLASRTREVKGRKNDTTEPAPGSHSPGRRNWGPTASRLFRRRKDGSLAAAVPARGGSNISMPERSLRRAFSRGTRFQPDVFLKVSMKSRISVVSMAFPPVRPSSRRWFPLYPSGAEPATGRDRVSYH